MHKCRITVLKRTCHEDLMEEYLDKSFSNRGPCSFFDEGQTYEVDPAENSNQFSERCFWAWWNIYDDVVKVATGGNIPGIEKKGTIITGCRDWFRPVLFKVERMD